MLRMKNVTLELHGRHGFDSCAMLMSINLAVKWGAVSEFLFFFTIFVLEYFDKNRGLPSLEALSYSSIEVYLQIVFLRNSTGLKADSIIWPFSPCRRAICVPNVMAMKNVACR